MHIIFKRRLWALSLSIFSVLVLLSLTFWSHPKKQLVQLEKQHHNVYNEPISSTDTATPINNTDTDTGSHGLALEDFKNAKTHVYNTPRTHDRFLSNAAWRPTNIYDQEVSSGRLRPALPHYNEFYSKASFLEQPLVADYAANSQTVFLMLKVGASLLWERLPIHLSTTLTRVPYFSIYSDTPGSIGGYRVVDILANVSAKTKESKEFKLYRDLAEMQARHANVDPKDSHLQGGWDLDKYKNIPMLAHALKVAPASVQWFVFMDGDSFFFFDNLIDWLKDLNPRDPLYMGSAARIGDVYFAHGGSGVVISRAALERSLGAHPEWETGMEKETAESCCGDYMVARMLEQANISLSRGHEYPGVGEKFNGQPFWNVYAYPENWCQRIVSFHHVNSPDIELLWEYERLLGPEQRKLITYGDIYHGFIAPYIDTHLPDWNNMARDQEFSQQQDFKDKNINVEEMNEEKKKEMFADALWYSEDNCKKACEGWKECLTWRFMPAEQYCGLSIGVKLGRPVLEDVKIQQQKHDSGKNLNGIVSGYMIDRIREVRKSQSCDVNYNRQDGDEVEGWYLQHD